MRTILPTVITVFLIGASPLHAQTGPAHDSHHAAQAGAQTGALVSAEVRKVDRATHKITLSHEPIPNLEMPKMTMVFQVKERIMLDRVKAGDKVKFAAARIDGQLTVVAIEAAK